MNVDRLCYGIRVAFAATAGCGLAHIIFEVYGYTPSFKYYTCLIVLSLVIGFLSIYFKRLKGISQDKVSGGDEE